MNNLGNLPPGITPQYIESIIDGVARDSNLVIGKKRRAKMRNTIRTNLLAGFPALQGTQKLLSFHQNPLTVSGARTEATNEIKIETPRMIQFSTGEPEVIVNDNHTTYTHQNCNQPNELMISSQNHWHLIMINHQGKFDKKDIIEALFDTVKDELFAPFSYTGGRETDYFLISNQFSALKKFFDAKLITHVRGVALPIIIKPSISPILKLQPKLVQKMFSVISNKMENLNNKDVLDLSNFDEQMEINKVIMPLKNKGCLKLLCDQLNGIDRLKTQFRVFKFANNQIAGLEPFTKLYGFTMNSLDLRNNGINSVEEMHFLKHLDIKEINVSGNFFTKIPKYKERINQIIPRVLVVDGVSQGAGPSVIPIDNKKSRWANSVSGAGNDLVPASEEGVLIRGDVRKREQFGHLKDSFNSYGQDGMWTKIIIQHGNKVKQQEIIDEVIPVLFDGCAFFPCYYTRLLNHDECLVYRNFKALSLLMANNLEYKIPPSDDKGGYVNKLVFSLKLNIAPFKEGQVDWHAKIKHVMHKRLRNDVLDLNGFKDDPLFEKMIVPMNTKFTLSLILELAKRENEAITRINAQGNGFVDLRGFQTIHLFKKLITLDLRNNKIKSLEGINQSPAVKELLLDGNPICSDFKDSHSYICEVMRSFYVLEWLDGIKIDQDKQLVTMQNYFVKRDAYNFAEEFIKTFFNSYDSFERKMLAQLYDDKSIFTLSIYCTIDRSHFSTQHVGTRIQHYARDHARNILILSDMERATANVVVGVKGIIKVFEQLTKTNHNFVSFCVDVPVFDPNHMVVITVTGIFEEHGQLLNEKSLSLGFSRTFILHPKENNEYCIANDQLFIHSLTPAQKEESDVNRYQPANENQIAKLCAELMPNEFEEKKLKLILFQELTELKREECIQQLEESFWDIKVALATFTTLMDSHSIPDSKFNFK